MIVRRSSGPPRALLAAAIGTGAIPAALAGAGGSAVHFGMTHQPLGQAQLTPNPDGSLSIANIGSSGNDGVTIDLGDAQGFGTTLRLSEGGSVACETIVCKMGRVELAANGPGIAQEFGIMLSAAAGPAQISLHTLNLQPLGGDILIHSDGAIVDAEKINGPPSGTLVTVDLAASTDPNVQIIGEVSSDFSCEFVDGRYILRAGVPLQMQIPGHPPVMGDQLTIRASIDRGNNENWNFGSATVLAGTCGASGQLMELEARLQALGLLCSATGDAMIRGTLSPQAQLILEVSNIGSSGQDGARIDLSNVPNSGLGVPEFLVDPPAVADVHLHPADPIDLGAVDDVFSITGRGTVATGVTGRGSFAIGQDQIAHVKWTNQQGMLFGEADFTAMGGTMLRVEVYNAGVLAGSAVMPDGGFAGQVGPGPLGLPKISDFGISRGTPPLVDGAPPVIISCRFDVPGSYRPPGMAPILGDEIRVMAEDPAHGVASLTALEFGGANLGTVAIDDIGLDSFPQATQLSFGINNIPLLGSFSNGAAGELVVSPPQGQIGEYGVAMPLGAAEGVMVELDLSQSPALPILNRTVLKSFFETGDVPTQAQFGYVIDSYIHQLDDGVTTFGAAISGFSAAQMTVELRLNGEVVDSAAYMPPFPEYAVSAPSLTFTGHELLASFAQDTDGNGGLDRVSFFFSEPVSFSAGHGVSPPPGSTVQTDTIVIRFEGCDLGAVKQCAAAVLVEGMPSFSILDAAPIMFGNAHRALGQPQMIGHACDADRALVVSNIGSSGEDGVSMAAGTLPFIVGNDPPVAFVLDGTRSQDDGVIQSFRWRQVGGPFVFNTQLGEVTAMQNASGGHDIVVGPVPWMAPESMTVKRYSNGTFVDEATGQTLGLAAFTFVPVIPDTYVFELVVVDNTGEVGSNAVSVSGVRHRFVWDAPVDLGLPGLPPVPVDRLDIIVHPSGDGVAGPVDLGAIELTASSDLPLDIAIHHEEVRTHNPCRGDISPSSGDSTVGVPDLLAIINGWGPCPAVPAACPADVSPPGGDETVGVPDLLAIINAWGPCP